MRNLLAGIDIGTSKVCALVSAASENGELALLGYGVVPCSGLRKGSCNGSSTAARLCRAMRASADGSPV